VRTGKLADCCGTTVWIAWLRRTVHERLPSCWSATTHCRFHHRRCHSDADAASCARLPGCQTGWSYLRRTRRSAGRSLLQTSPTSVRSTLSLPLHVRTTRLYLLTDRHFVCCFCSVGQRRKALSAKLHYTDTGHRHVVEHHQRTSSQQFYNLLYNKFTTNGQKFATF